MLLMASGRTGGARPRLRVVEPAQGRGGGDDAKVLEGLRRGEPWAREALFDRYGALVERTVRRILGREFHTDLADVIHDCFVQALESLHRIRDPAALPGYMRAIAARTSCKSIRARAARRWLRFWEPQAIPDVPVRDVDPDVRDAYVRTYAVLDRLGAEARVAFVLRHVEGLELTEVGAACGVSLATIKRRLARAETRFAAAASRDPVLRSWLAEGGRWTT